MAGISESQIESAFEYSRDALYYIYVSVRKGPFAMLEDKKVKSAVMQSTVNLADEKHRRIVKAGTDVFLQYGYNGTDLMQIADAARLPARMVCELVEGKQQVFAYVIEALHEKSMEDAQAAEALARVHHVSAAELLTSVLAARVGACIDVRMASSFSDELFSARGQLFGMIALDQDLQFLSWLQTVIDREISVGRMHVRSSISTKVIANDLCDAAFEVYDQYPLLKWTELHRRISAKVKVMLAHYEP
jgi:AcrR family transcriptional regulator